MTIEDLQEEGVLLPEEEWGERELTTTVGRWLFLAAFLLAAAGCALAYFGGGGLLTWVGIGLFTGMLFSLVWLCDRAVVRQRRRARRR